jgi:alkaline phosphatase D
MNVDRRFGRRAFLAWSGAVALAACANDSTTSGPSTTRAPSGTNLAKVTTTSPDIPPIPTLARDPFELGVASGDPSADGFVLWTRLTQDPLHGGGMPEVDVPVRWMVGDDEDLRRVVAEGTFVTGADRAHAVHAIVSGLDPARPYWYRFALGEYETDIARTRTLPAPNAKPERFRFGFASCQNYKDGYYTAWSDVAAADLDLVVFLGDYIYESGLEGLVRAHDVVEVVTLDEYRNRYALYKSDPRLRAAHATAPWVVTWDDHEVDNNYQGDNAEANSPTPDPAQFARRRRAGYRAWWEHTPSRLPAPSDDSFPIHRRFDVGTLARFHVLDTRQFRDDQPCAPGSDIGAVCDESQMLTVLGTDQERWLEAGLAESTATWDVLAQQIVFSRLAFTLGPDGIRNLDQWDGYPAARARIIEQLQRRANPVVITGDIHASGVARVTADFEKDDAPHVGTEFVGTSIASNAPESLKAVVPVALANNPHLLWADADRRGWVRCEVTPTHWLADFRHTDALVVDAPVRTDRSWVVEAGRPVAPA